MVGVGDGVTVDNVVLVGLGVGVGGVLHPLGISVGVTTGGQKGQ